MRPFSDLADDAFGGMGFDCASIFCEVAAKFIRDSPEWAVTPSAVASGFGDGRLRLTLVSL